MTLAILEDLIAVEDVADLAHVGPLLAWLDRHGLLDTGRVLVCAARGCGRPFVRHRLANNQRFCSETCCKRAWRQGPTSDRRRAA